MEAPFELNDMLYDDNSIIIGYKKLWDRVEVLKIPAGINCYIIDYDNEKIIHENEENDMSEFSRNELVDFYNEIYGSDNEQN